MNSNRFRQRVGHTPQIVFRTLFAASTQFKTTRKEEINWAKVDLDELKLPLYGISLNDLLRLRGLTHKQALLMIKKLKANREKVLSFLKLGESLQQVEINRLRFKSAI